MTVTDLRDTVLKKVESLRDYLVSTTQELVRIPSVNHPPTGDEYDCQMAVARYLRDMQLEPEVYALDDVPGLKEHAHYWPLRDYSKRPNVVTRRRGAGGGRSLLLSGHIDTVPLGAHPWKHDPFGAEIVEGRLYGLGSYDMKGGLVTILGVLRALQELDIPLKGDLIAESVVDEEFGGVNGTIAGRVRGDNADAAVIPEPSGLDIFNGARGCRLAHITLSGAEGIMVADGEPGHAVRELAHFLKWVDIFRQRQRAKIPNWQGGPDDPVPVWVTKVTGGGWGFEKPITIPAEIKVEMYWQFLGDVDQAQVDREFFAWLDEMVADKPNDFAGQPEVEFPIRFMLPCEMAPDAPIIQTLAHCSQEVIGHQPIIKPLPAPSDLYAVQRLFNIPAVHYGPGGAGAHSADEYVLVDDLVTATKTLTLLALDWCGVA
jgi:acetylornithine deacetylase